METDVNSISPRESPNMQQGTDAHLPRNNSPEEIVQIPVNISLMAKVRRAMEDAIKVFKGKNIDEWPKTFKIPKQKVKMEILNEINSFIRQTYNQTKEWTFL